MRIQRRIKKLTSTIQLHNQEIIQEQKKNVQLFGILQEDFSQVMQYFEGASDFAYRELKIDPDLKIMILYLDGLVDIERIELNVINPLVKLNRELVKNIKPTIEDIKAKLSAAQVKKGETIQEIINRILSGDTVLLIDGLKQSLLINEHSWEKRAVEEPLSEAVVLGPREGFTENIRTNTSMIRRRLKTTKLKFESIKIGNLSQTEVIITYLDGIAQNSIIEEVRSRLNQINIDAIEDSGYIVELIEDHPYSVFPQILQTERPDRVVGNLLEGRVSIIVENSPFALIVPVTFFQMMISPEDYYGKYIMATFVRFIRYLFLLVALLFPAIYIAVTTFHQELLPTNLLFSVAASREKVPFPAVIEALLMEITFEALREAGLRLPRPIGSTVSIVGALVVGEAAVEAGIVSAPLVIVVATTGIASFMFPNYNLTGAIRLLRFLMIFLAATLGFYGILLGVFFILVHLVQLRSFGVPYLAPLAPFNFNNLKDVIIRAPWWLMNERPEQTGKRNLRRLGPRNRKY